MLPADFLEIGPLRTERLILRMMTADDVGDVHAYQGDPEVCRYQLFEARSREEVVVKVGEHAASTVLRADGDYWQIAVELPEVGKRRSDAAPHVIGDIYFTIKSVENLGGEIGWTFATAYQGKGYATEAASAVLDLAFDRLGLHRVIAELDPRNSASIRMCRRLGLREEALFAQDLMFRGAWADTGVYAILEEEWAAR